MGLRDLTIQDSYRSDEYEDLGTAFVSKMLEQCIDYRRAVGFFSSSALIKLSTGLSVLTQKEGAHVSFVMSPILSKEDIEAISKGYERRNEIIEGALIRNFSCPSNEFEEERLNYLCHLIELGILDIKIADKFDSRSNNQFGIFHEKIGIFTDEKGDSVAFTGSLNESDNAFSNNFESIQVFTSWDERKRVLILDEDFQKLWENRTRSLEVYDFPEAVKKSLFQYRKSTWHPDVDEYEKKKKLEIQLSTQSNFPSCRYKFELYDYQKNALNQWARQGYVGLFDMATGTGKTITALTGVVKLLERTKYRMATIIVCPYTHLVEQWVDEEENFNIHFIVGYSSVKYKNYLSELRRTIQDFNDEIIPYFFFITTNASYKLDKVQKILQEIKGNVLFIGDEVHNFGAEGLRQALNPNYKYRIGLSATIDRPRDEDGTNAIYEYFGKPVIHYGLQEAIQNDVLTRYFYYPIVVPLSEKEQEKYRELTALIRKHSSRVKGGKIKLSKTGERYALMRARLVATAENKLEALKKAIIPVKNESNILVYCGTGKTNCDQGEERQIDAVCQLLGNQLQMKVARYTSQENTEERKDIAERFKNGRDLQALVAIKCLDEGVNIPSIKTAFILASSTNPREYIQRRGRVLRKFPGKSYSYIHDFITVPVSLDETDLYDSKYLSTFKALLKNEVERMKEFAFLSENSMDSNDLINELTERFSIGYEEDNEEYEQIEWEDDE